MNCTVLKLKMQFYMLVLSTGNIAAGR